MVKYIFEYTDNDDSGIDGYVGKKNSRPLPSYFQPTNNGAGIAHDVVDHLISYSVLHPIMDEYIAIGAAYYRSDNEIILKNDIESLTSAFVENITDIYTEEKPSSVLYTPPVIKIKDHEQYNYLTTLVEVFVSRYYDKEHFIVGEERLYFPYIETVAKLLDYGYWLAHQKYKEPTNAAAIYSKIQEFTIKHRPKEEPYYIKSSSDRYPTFKFHVYRDTGDVVCLMKEPYELYYYGG